MDRINSVGVPIPDELPPLYYHPQKNQFWWFNSHDGNWQEFNQEGAKSLLVSRYGQNLLQAGRGQLAGVDITLGRIRVENRLHAVAKLGWEETGIQVIEGEQWLVKKGCKRIEPIAGSWEDIRIYLLNLFGEEQLERFLGWLQNAVLGFYFRERRRYGQALILAGPAGSGKSFLQMQIITPALGGKIGRPYAWLTKEVSFNSELFEAVHLVAEDEFYLADFSSKRIFSSAIKRVTANTTQIYNEKHNAQVVCKPYWRLSISLNNEVHHLATLPELDGSLADKLMIFETNGQATHLSTEGDNPMEQAVKAQLPAFIHYLLYEHKVREEIADKRYGIQAYINPTIKEALTQISDEEYVLQALEETIFPNATDVRVSQNALCSALGAQEVSAPVRRMAANKNQIEDCMRKLASRPDSGVKRVKGGWSLTFVDNENK